MKIKELREKETDAILADLKATERHLFDLRTQAVTEKLENPRSIGQARRDIARIKTVLRERQLAEAKKAAN